MAYDAKVQWTRFYAGKALGGKTYPCEHLVRIFMGRHPRLDLDKSRYREQVVCDLGCGDGRNLVLFHDLGLDTHGVEISPEIAENTRQRLLTVEQIDVDIRVGTNEQIPFEDESLDYLVSWCSCYYMGPHADFQLYVREFARVLRPGGFFIASLVTPRHVQTYSAPIRPGYCVLRDDPVGIRDGETLRIFENQQEIEGEFGEHFDRFVLGSQSDDNFGDIFDAWLLVCQRKDGTR